MPNALNLSDVPASVFSISSLPHAMWIAGMPVLMVITAIFALAHLWGLFKTEQGRKQDLLRKPEALTAPNTETHVAILLPYTQPSHLNHLADLLDALEEQAYPITRYTIHIATTEDTHADLLQLPLPSNAKLWQHPSLRFEPANLQAWLIERCLAANSGDLYVFLQPTDIIKPDFLQAIVNRSFDAFVIQGYLASRYRPITPIEKLTTLATRLGNRIDNALRYHTGGSAILKESGWAIKQELLEMVPYVPATGNLLDHLAYTIHLNLEKFRVVWAPTATVYQDDYAPLSQQIQHVTESTLYRLSLALRYAPKLIWQGVSQFKLGALKLALDLFKLPAYWIGFSALLLTAFGALPAWQIWGGTLSWLIVSATVFTLHVAGLAVARSKPADYVTTLFWVPISYLCALALSPWGLVQCALNQTLRQRKNGIGLGHSKPLSRFNEAMPALANTPQDEYAPEAGFAQRLNAAQQAQGQQPPHNTGYMSTPNLPAQNWTPAEAADSTNESRIKWVPVTNGTRHVDCQLKTITEEDGRYTLILEYKGVAFQTARYRILDQAFYELHSKLGSRGLTILTCGSCGYFYNPASAAAGSRVTGVCLFGKLGKTVDVVTDAVTVTSQACPHHRDIEEREFLVKQWQQSQTNQAQV
ncbi:MAG: hypothetical protein VKJ06_02290 [Vampirovibrionales bacterium]|nr:hypothetical protein [Vampirovibrionales bacterium]